MELNQLIGKRILIAEKTSGYNSKQTIEEIKLLEVSPSGKWVKVQTLYGNKFWKANTEITPIEILADLEKRPTD